MIQLVVLDSRIMSVQRADTPASTRSGDFVRFTGNHYTLYLHERTYIGAAMDIVDSLRGLNLNGFGNAFDLIEPPAL